MIVGGYLYRSGSSARTEATLTRDDAGYRLSEDGGADRPVAIRAVADRLAGVPQAVTLETGERFVPHAELPAGFLGAAEGRAARWLDWLERISPLKAGALIVLFVLGVFAVRAAIPVAVGLAVALVPKVVEGAVGGEAFRELDAALFSPTALTVDRRRSIVEAARTLAGRGGIEWMPEIRFRKAPVFGANAFALPGGPILVTDDLVRVLKEDRKIRAVLAHELGHVEGRHGLRQALRIGGLFLVASMVLGTDDSLLEELSALVVGLSSSGYSRRFESEADAFAARLLEASGASPADLADALDTLTRDCGEACRADRSWFATHPAIEDRITRLRAAP